MRLRTPDLSLLLKPHISVFKYTKKGIVTRIGYNEINLTTLFITSPDECLQLLERLEESDIDKYNLKEVIAIRNEFKEIRN